MSSEFRDFDSHNSSSTTRLTCVMNGMTKGALYLDISVSPKNSHGMHKLLPLSVMCVGNGTCDFVSIPNLYDDAFSLFRSKPDIR